MLRSELAKLTSLRSTVWCLSIGMILMVALSAWIVSSSKFYGDLPEPTDAFSFAHGPMTGDGSVVARVSAQDASHPWAKAGIIIKESTASGSRYAALMLTPGHGVRLEADFTTGIAGSRGGGGGAPRWLKLTRNSDEIIGYESGDGASWSRVGSVKLGGLAPTVAAGLFVTSPLAVEYARGGGAEAVGITPTIGRAVFDNVSASGLTYLKVAPEPVPDAPQPRPGPGGMTETGGVYTVVGDGDIAWYGIPSYVRLDTRDTISDSLQGVQIGLLAMVVLGVLAGTAEYKTGMIRTTLAASPRRGRVLAAKAAAVGGISFVAGLLASTATFLVTQPILRDRGVRPPAYPYRTLAEFEVLRAVAGTAAVLALLALLGLAAGMLLRRSSRAIPLVIAVVLVPQLVGAQLSLEAYRWVGRLTPTAGLAIQQTIERYDTAIGPWAGLGVLAAYAALGLAAALWSLRRRDA